MDDESQNPTPAGQLLLLLEAFYTAYKAELHQLTAEQIRTIYRRLDRYAREVEDDAARADPPSS
jgi:hypothetical protein